MHSMKLTASDTANASMLDNRGLKGECFAINLTSTLPLKKFEFSFINCDEMNTWRHAIIVQNKKHMKNLWVFSPIQLPVHGQWWSILMTHCPHMLQWWDLGGFNTLHVLHTLNPMKLSILSFMFTLYLTQSFSLLSSFSLSGSKCVDTLELSSSFSLF